LDVGPGGPLIQGSVFMTAAPQADARRRRIRNMTIAAAAVGALLVAGVGTASASDRGRWKKHHQPGASASASRSAAAKPSASTSSSAAGGASGGASASATTSPAATTTTQPTATSSASNAAGLTLPPANAQFDYQIGSAYTPPSGVQVVSRDRGASPAAGIYNICYINGFQAQPDELASWKANHDDLLLKSGGSYVVDSGWNEVLLDISTSAKRTALTTIVGGWMDGCASKGFKAVEIDNLDSWTRSKNLLTQAEAVSYATLLATYAHGKGLAIAQKNTVEISKVGKSQIGFDFAIAEQCADYEISSGTPECQGYVDAYGSHVIVIEYDSSHFQQACTKFGATLSIVQRDVDVTAPGSSAYVYKSC
jgi:Glycoside-hydrolase family GH114